MRVLFCFFVSAIFISCGADEKEMTKMEQVSQNYEVIELPADTTIENLSLYVIDRNVLMIDLFSDDSIFVNNELKTKDELKESIRYFYEANSETEKDFEMPQYSDISLLSLDSKINTLTLVTKGKPDDQKLKDELEKLKIKRKICTLFPSESFREISDEATIHIQMHPNTEKNLYSKIRDLVAKEIEKLRSEMQSEIDRDISNVDGTERKSILEILFPERILAITLEE